VPNNAKHFYSKSLSTFVSIPSPPLESCIYEDQQVIKKQIDTFIKAQDLKRAEEKGYKKAHKEIEENIKKIVDGYLILVTKIADFINDIAKKEFEGFDIKIIETRTNFYFLTQRISLLFIVDGSFNSEKEFSTLLNQAEQEFLEKGNILTELLYLNCRKENLDHETIEHDYPFKRKID